MSREHQCDDRLSGYLDGELPSSEAAAIERQLAVDPSLRQLRDDLLMLRGELKALPIQRPSQGLTDRIMAAVAATETAEPDVHVTLPARAGKKPLPAWATFSMGMVASAAMVLVAFTLFDRNNHQPNVGTLAVAPKPEEKGLGKIETAEGEGDQWKLDSTIVEQGAMANDVPQIADVLRKGLDRAGVVHVLRLPMSANQLRGGALDKALLGQKFIVTGALDRKELVPHVALAYRSLPQARLVAGADSPRRPVAEIIYLDLPSDRVSDTLTALAAQGSAGQLAPEVRLSMVPSLVEVASAYRGGSSTEAEGEGGSKAAKGSDKSSGSESSQRPMAIRVGVKQLKNALGDNFEQTEFAGPEDDEVDVLVFVRLLGK
jgi:hypothetical protein